MHGSTDSPFYRPMIGDGSIVQRLLSGRQAHDVGGGFIGALRAGIGESPLLHDTAFAGSTQRSAAGAAEGVVFRDSRPRSSTPPARTVVGVVRARRPSATAHVPPPIPTESDRFRKVPAPSVAHDFGTYPVDSHRAVASLGVTPSENAAFPNAPASGLQGRELARPLGEFDSISLK